MQSVSVPQLLEKCGELVSKVGTLWKNHRSFRWLTYLSTALVVRNAYIVINRKWRRLPPGPKGIPFLGSALSMGSDTRKFLLQTVPSYGPLTLVQVGAKYMLFTNEINVTKEILRSTLDRIDFPLPAHMARPFMFEANGHVWDHRRKLMYRALADIGSSDFLNETIPIIFDTYIKPKIDQSIVDDCDFYFRDYLAFSTFSVVYKACFGNTIDHSDPKRQRVFELSKTFFTVNFVVVFFSCIPLPIPHHWLPAYHTLSDIRNKLSELMSDMLADNNLSWDTTYQTKDRNLWAAELLINDMNSTANQIVTKKDVLLDLATQFLAGVDTTLNTTEYGLCLLAKNPKIQTMVYNELKSVFADDDRFVLNQSNIAKLPLFRAFIHETIRIANVVPSGVPRHINGLKDGGLKVKTVDGKEYLIPNGTIVFPNLLYVMPQMGTEINLNLWLDENDRFRMNKDGLGFSIGKRDCPGQSFARRDLYATFGYLLLKYEICGPNNATDFEIKQTLDSTSCIEPQIGFRLKHRQ